MSIPPFLQCYTVSVIKS